MRARFSQGALNGKNESSLQWLGYLLSCLIVRSALGQTNNVRIPAFEWAIEAGSRLNDAGTAIAVDESGNCYVTGSFAGVADFSGTNLTSFGGTDIYVAKYSAVGALQWVRQAGGVVDDVGRAVAVDSSGNCYVVGDFGWSSGGTANFGNTNVVSAGGTDVFVAKYNPNGDVEWARTYGGGGFDRGNGIAADLQGKVWITGQSGDGNGLAFVVKYSSAGIVQWAQRGGGDYAAGVAIATDKSGNSFVTGRFSVTGSFGNITLTNARQVRLRRRENGFDGSLPTRRQLVSTTLRWIGSATFSSSELSMGRLTWAERN